MAIIRYLELPLTFPAGVHLGAGKRFNSLIVARDGAGHPILNGTSLVGILRSIWRDRLAFDQWDTQSKNVYELANQRRRDGVKERVDVLFGRAHGSRSGDEWQDDDDEWIEQDDLPSCVRVTNYPFAFSSPDVERNPVHQRTHHLRNRHRGTVVERGLFSIENCPPGTSVTVGLWVNPNASLEQAEIDLFFQTIVAAFEHGVHLGGNSNRGIGRALVDKRKVFTAQFDLTDLSQHAGYLEAHRAWRQGLPIKNLKPFEANVEESELIAARRFSATVVLEIPVGQDMLVADGQADEVTMEPQRVRTADGSYSWRLPGSSLRGLFQHWFQRLHVRESIKVGNGVPSLVDSADDYPARESALREYESVKDSAVKERLRQSRYSGDNLAWCFKNEDERKDFKIPDDWVIASLFGSCFHPGRIKISDGFAPCSQADFDQCSEAQQRMHVAVDRVTGGAAEGMLFDNRVLIASPQVKFPVTISIENPRDHEIRWLAQTLIALDLGVLRVGSSKSAGRVVLSGLPTAAGAFTQDFLHLIEHYIQKN